MISFQALYFNYVFTTNFFAEKLKTLHNGLILAAFICQRSLGACSHLLTSKVILATYMYRTDTVHS